MTIELITGGLAILLMSKLLVPNLINKPGDHAIGCIWSKDYTYKSILSGLILGFILLLFSGGNTYPKFVSDFSLNKSFELVCMILSILLLAPIIEEFLFRGVLYAGFVNTWSKDISSVLITTIFVLIHLPAVEFKVIPLFSILALAITTLIFRKKSGNIGPSIMVHFSYNLVVLSFVFIKNF
jgi:membrane protease YdiL (CAAX protease family)